MKLGQKNEWLNNLEKVTSTFPERKKEFKTESGINLKALYEPDPNLNYEEEISYPGLFPFTRGVQPNMYRGRFWTMRQYAGFGDAEVQRVRRQLGDAAVRFDSSRHVEGLE